MKDVINMTAFLIIVLIVMVAVSIYGLCLDGKSVKYQREQNDIHKAILRKVCMDSDMTNLMKNMLNEAEIAPEPEKSEEANSEKGRT